MAAGARTRGAGDDWNGGVTMTENAIAMTCKTCGRDLPPYHFFNPRGKYNKHFFIHGVVPNMCFECAGPYRCAGCNEIKPASAFRIQGRLCADCRQEGVLYATNNDFGDETVSEAIDSVETPEMEADE